MQTITNLVKETGITEIIFDLKNQMEIREKLMNEIKQKHERRHEEIEYHFEIDSYAEGIYQEIFSVCYIDLSSDIECITITKEMDLEIHTTRTYDVYIS